MLSRATKVIAAFAGFLSVTACSILGSTAAPEPDYSVNLAEPPFELRDYGELVVVKTAVNDGSRAAFGRLFDYISGANSGAREIAMTAPVLNTDTAKGAKIAMTVPVLQTQEGSREMIFILPDTLTLDSAPAPTAPRVSLARIPPRRVAVVRYSGSMSNRASAEETRLRDWMTSKELTPTGPAEVAGYNPPWTLPSYRRNEVLIPVKKD
ncbi:heme-binding protein [Rhodovulum sulfidophilum]|uniref:SOUL family heme-binding protein n=1 Tax=Rhodovulum sulfidophilum TaxID=35806 RepID=UPI0019243A6B|nr:heme-binding protein [Rhodovulum sulfidophilum]MBL3573571.1 heme-binding protein [Rhodovulum sulfidophilum]MCE8429972.1 heme-binding protein [Rhodovulum sulfidophilum]MCF4118712.1 heme-binding protein [Rhodovulum sulfidophilum]